MLKTLERYQKCNYGAPETNVSAREALVIQCYYLISRDGIMLSTVHNKEYWWETKINNWKILWQWVLIIKLMERICWWYHSLSVYSFKCQTILNLNPTKKSYIVVSHGEIFWIRIFHPIYLWAEYILSYCCSDRRNWVASRSIWSSRHVMKPYNETKGYCPSYLPLYKIVWKTKN